VVSDHSRRSASVVVAERSDRSLRACSSTSNITSVMSSQQSIRTMPAVLSSNNSSVLPPVVYNVSNCTVYHVGSSMPNSSSSSDIV
jgi:hypothetical protein